MSRTPSGSHPGFCAVVARPEISKEHIERWFWPAGMTLESFLRAVAGSDNPDAPASLLAIAQKGILPNGVAARSDAPRTPEIRLELLAANSAVLPCSPEVWKELFLAPQARPCTVRFQGVEGASVRWTCGEKSGAGTIPYSFEIPAGARLQYTVKYSSFEWSGEELSKPGQPLEITINPPPRPRQVQFTVIPPHATVKWSAGSRRDGQVEGSALIEVQAERIDFEVSAEGYESAVDSRDLGPADGPVTSILVELKRKAGRILLDAQPREATIHYILDGSAHSDIGSASVVKHSPARIEFQVRFPGYISQKLALDLQPGLELARKVQLSREPRSFWFVPAFCVAFLATGVFQGWLPRSDEIKTGLNKLAQDFVVYIKGAPVPESDEPAGGETDSGKLQLESGEGGESSVTVKSGGESIFEGTGGDTSLELSPGEHEVKQTGSGFTETKERVEVTPGAEKTVGAGQ